jgi:hypothetical protein
MSFGTGARLSLVGGLAALGAALALLLSAGHASGADPMKMNMNMSMSKTGASAKAVKLRLGMNKLWEDHVIWTRMVIVDFAANLPDLQTAEGRLLRNQADIGNAIKPYYGAAAGKKLTSLLRTHILEAVPVLQDAKAGDNAKLQRDLAKWYANAHQIAVFLSTANPHNWPLKEMDKMMKRHLQLTTDEAVARLKGNWSADVKAYDRVHAEILQMAGMLSTGIIKQFPAASDLPRCGGSRPGGCRRRPAQRKVFAARTAAPAAAASAPSLSARRAFGASFGSS